MTAQRRPQTAAAPTPARLLLARRRSRTCLAAALLIGGSLLLAASPAGAARVAARPSWSPALHAAALAAQVQLVAPDGAAGDQAGWSVALDGDSALVGAPRDDVAGNADQGSVYVFVRSAGSWVLQAHLTAVDGAAGDGFGRSVAVSGDTALIGADEDDVGGNIQQGSAYVFVRSGAAWSQQQQLFAPDGGAGHGFGFSVALDGDTALVGDPGKPAETSVGVGSAHVFVRSGAAWSVQQQITAADGAESDRLGSSVALEDDTALVGAVGHKNGTGDKHGAAYVFARSGTTWSQQALLTGVASSTNEFFGDAVALDGGTAVVGAPFDHVGGVADQGSAYAFTRSGAAWTLQQRIVVTETEPSGDHFGSAVALHDDTVLIGAPDDEVFRDDGSSVYSQGTATCLVRSGGVWTRQARLTAADGAVQDHFGFAVALGDDAALVGALDDDIGGRGDQGSAYIFAGVAPVTTATLKPVANVFGWNRTAVTVTLKATDLFSGVASTEYRLAGVPDWTTYAGGFAVSGNGVSTREYRSVDRDGMVEATRVLKVRIDTTRPVTKALANASVARGGKGFLRFRVNDAISPKAWGTIKIYKGTALKKTLMFPERPTNTVLRYPFTCKLPRGRYTWKVYAADLASNKQSKVGSKALIVR